MVRARLFTAYTHTLSLDRNEKRHPSSPQEMYVCTDLYIFVFGFGFDSMRCAVNECVSKTARGASPSPKKGTVLVAARGGAHS